MTPAPIQSAELSDTSLREKALRDRPQNITEAALKLVKDIVAVVDAKEWDIAVYEAQDVATAAIITLSDAKDRRIEVLEAENKRLRKGNTTLRKVVLPFARLALNYSGNGPSDAVFAKGCVYVNDLRAARTALSGKEGQS